VDDKDAPLETPWAGKYVRILRRGRWEFAARTNATRAVVVLAEHEGKVVLIEQYRVPVGGRCLELPAGLVGDEDPDATLEETAIKELEEEAGFTAERVELLGDYHSSPGMVTESFTLVRAHGVQRIGSGGGTEHEEIDVHPVAWDEIADFIAERRRAGVVVDVKLLMFQSFSPDAVSTGSLRSR
jgi:ADP-ribose pyrophosphatase